PFGLAGLEQTPVAGSHIPASWHWSLAVHVTGAPGAHMPPWQTSATVQALPSEQVLPSGLVGFEQRPVDGLQVPASWQSSLAVHVTGLPPTQAPVWQVSVWLQASPSLQVLPLGASGVEHIPLAGLHVPATWHWSLAVQTTGLPPTQAPAMHESACVQPLLSLQA